MIELQNITLPGADGPLCDGLGWQLPDPGTYLLLGGTGSGKTVLCSLLAGRLRPRSGSVLIDGHSVYRPWRPAGADSWLASAHLDYSYAEPLQEYVQRELLAAGGQLKQLAELWPLLESQLAISRRQDLARLSHGQLLLAQVMLAACVPSRVVILDGHLSYLDNPACATAGQLLGLAGGRQDRFVLLTAARLPGGNMAFDGIFQLSDAAPLEIGQLREENAAVHGSHTSELVLSPRADSLPAGKLASGRSFAVLSDSGGSYRVRLLGSVSQLLAELEGQGVKLARMEWPD